MKNRTLNLFPIGLALLLSTCTAPGVPGISSSSEPTVLGKATLLRSPESLSHAYQYSDTLNEGYCAFKGKLTAFSARLSESLAKREAKENQNIAFSPLSVELCLGLGIRGANGNTRQQMLDALDVDYETFNQYYKLYFNESWREYYNESKELVAQNLLTNSIWFDDAISLKEEGLNALRDDYYCYSFETDFDQKNAQANQAIQDFINEKTKGLLNPNLDLSPATLFVLMNTLYLKDIWNDAGDDLQFASAAYHFANDDRTISKKQLLQGHYFSGRTMREEDYSSFFTETAHGLVLTFIKPNEGKNAKEVFTQEAIAKACDSKNYVYQDSVKKERYHTSCVFPEFKADSDIDLIPIFQDDYGVNDLFDGRCDFGNLTDTPVYCETFRHIATLDVTKTGIEGAAVTYMAVCGSAAPDETYTDVYETFLVDRSFGFVLSYRGIHLFSGIVSNIDK